MTRPDITADKIVLAILADVTDRRGWRQEWDQFDEDARNEIIAEWRSRVLAILRDDYP